VEPARLVFAGYAPQAEHLARLAHADLFLDSFVCNAHTTASDALWAGLPLLTCPGSGFPARVSASLLIAAGLPELVAPSVEAYAALALTLATEPGPLAALRQRLTGSRTGCALFDTPAHTRALEAGWSAIIERARAGLPPGDIAL
jgi:predicted O-linked N-acetylglucosamine transferase (SPINDLY family)